MKTLYDKIWDNHVVVPESDAPAVLYIDIHLIHEVTTPQAFAGLKQRGVKVRRTDKTFGTMDHSIPTSSRSLSGCGELRRIWSAAVRPEQYEAGNRSRHRSGTRTHATRAHDRLRRQPHIDTWR